MALVAWFSPLLNTQKGISAPVNVPLSKLNKEQCIVGGRSVKYGHKGRLLAATATAYLGLNFVGLVQLASLPQNPGHV